MSYQKPYTFDERKDARKLKDQLSHIFSCCTDDEIEDLWLKSYEATTKDLIRVLRMLFANSR